MKIMTCALAALMLLPGAAHAGEWRIIGADHVNATFLDTSTVRIPGQRATKTAWLAIALPTTSEHGVDYFMVQDEFDCEAMTITELSMHAYSAAGNVVDASTTRKTAEPVIPDTRGQAMHSAVCDGTDARASARITDALALYREILAEGD